MKFSRAQLSWILYDMANAAFALIVRTVFAPMFYKNYAAVGMEPATATSSWGLVSSAAGIVAGILAPWLGAVADANGGRKRCLGGFMAAGILAVIGLCFAGTGDATLVLTLYFVSLVSYMGSNSTGSRPSPTRGGTSADSFPSSSASASCSWPGAIRWGA